MKTTPSPQAGLICSSFLRHSRDYYDAYEDIRESTSGEHHDLDMAILFESMAFLMFILDFELFCSRQSDEVNDYIFDLCNQLVVYTFSDYEGKSFGSKQKIHESIQHRIERYSKSLRGKNEQGPAVFFSVSGSLNPVTNNMEAARDSSIIAPENASMMIGDGLVEFGIMPALLAVYISKVGPFQFGLQHLFHGNENFLSLTEQEVKDRLSLGAEEAQRRLENLKG